MPGQDRHRAGPASEPEREPHRESSTATPVAAQAEPSGPGRTETDECYIPADITHPEPDGSTEEHDSAEAIADQPRLWRARPIGRFTHGGNGVTDRVDVIPARGRPAR